VRWGRDKYGHETGLSGMQSRHDAMTAAEQPKILCLLSEGSGDEPSYPLAVPALRLRFKTNRGLLFWRFVRRGEAGRREPGEMLWVRCCRLASYLADRIHLAVRAGFFGFLRGTRRVFPLLG
jgi:hypothetical protein